MFILLDNNIVKLSVLDINTGEIKEHALSYDKIIIETSLL